MVRAIYVDLGEDREVEGWGSSSISDKCVRLLIDENHEFFNDNPFLYRYTNRTLVKDPSLVAAFEDKEKQGQLERTALNQDNRIKALELVILELLGGF